MKFSELPYINATRCIKNDLMLKFFTMTLLKIGHTCVNVRIGSLGGIKCFVALFSFQFFFLIF